jgi:hypothetical protein
VAGLRVRVPAVPAILDLYATLGALPQSLGFAAAQAAFKSGALDGQDGPAASFVAARLEASGFRHVADWQAVGEIAVFAVNRAVWNAWSDAERAFVREAATATAGSWRCWPATRPPRRWPTCGAGLATTRPRRRGTRRSRRQAARLRSLGGGGGVELVRAAEAAVRGGTVNGHAGLDHTFSVRQSLPEVGA